MSLQDTRSELDKVLGLFDLAGTVRDGLAASGVQSGEDMVQARRPKSTDNLLGLDLSGMPQSPMAAAREKYGKGGLFFRDLLSAGGRSIFASMLLPEVYGEGARDRYKAEMALYKDRLKNQMAGQNAAKYEGMLSDDNPENDLEAIRMGAIHQPDIYGPVLRDMMQRQHNPTEETMFAPNYQLNPQTGEWEMVQTGNLGTTNRTGMGADFLPESRMPSPEYIDKSIYEADVRYRSSLDGASEARGIIDQMDSIGEDGWASGLRGEASEFYKDVTGTQDFVSTVRKNYQDVKVRNGIKNLPPGVASDKDIELALSPWPDDTSDFNFIKRKLEAIERIETGRAEYARFESEYIARNQGRRNGLQSAWEKTEQAQTVKSSNKPTRNWEFVD